MQNNPVNFRDLFGLSAGDVQISYQVPCNSNDYHCDIKAWNKAIDNLQDPRPSDKSVWDGNSLTVSDIAKKYPRYDNPLSNTAGFAWYDGDADGNPEHMEYYDNSNENPNTYIQYYTDGIKEIKEIERDIDDPRNSKWTYTPLEWGY